MIRVETTWLEHSGGTKFYETALFLSDSGLAMLVKRYGSIDKARGGGQLMVHQGSAAEMRREAAKIIGEKTSSKKGYSEVASTYELHGNDPTTKFKSWAMLDRVRRHYGSTSQAAQAFNAHFGASDTADEPTTQAFPTPAEPEIDRGSTWGSF